MESFVLIFVGIIVIILGAIIFSGHIEIIHSYNRTRITEETRKPYGRSVGTGSIILGAGITADGLISVLAESFPPVITILCLTAGVALIFYGQFKYNKGIF